MINIIILNMKKMSKDISNLLICGITILLLSACTPNKSVQMKTEKTVSIDTSFYPNGQIEEICAIIDSVKQGLCIGYDTLGYKTYESTFVDGEWYGPFIAYNSFSHNIMTKAFYKNGVWEGEFISYYENGNIRYKKNFTDGKANGISYVYTDDGALAQKLLYKDDEVVEVIFNNGELALPDPPPVD